MTAVLPHSAANKNSRAHPGVFFAGNFHARAGGFLSVCEELSARLASSGWPVVTASTRRGRIAKGVDMMATAWRTRRQYNVAQIDVFSGAAFAWAEAVAFTVARAGRPIVLTLHGGLLPEFAARWPGRVRRLLNMAAVVTAPSPFLGHQMQRYRADIRVLPNALALDAYASRVRSCASPSLVWVRAFHRMYNPMLLPKVVARLAERVPNIRAVMVGPDKGDGSLRETQEIAERMGVLDRINFVGGVPHADVPRLLDAADIFVNTTNVDNTPVSVMEAMASGLCVVSTAVGGLPFLLADGMDALLVPPDDEVAMADAIARVLSNATLCRQLSTAARARAHEFAWANILPQWETLLATVVDTHG